MHIWPFGKRTRAEAPSHGAPQQIPTVSFDPRRVTAAVRSDIEATLKSAPEIPASGFGVAYDAAIRCASDGGNLAVLAQALEGLGLTRGQALDVARFVHRRARAVIERERQLSVGIEEAEWLYSGAPCMVNPSSPSPEEVTLDALHAAANGKRYPVAKGMLIGGRRVWPGQDRGCKCVSKAVVPGFT